MTEAALPPAPAEYEGADEIVRYALARVRIEARRSKDYLDDCREQLETAELLHHEAVTAERELARLIEGGELYRQNPQADAEAFDPRHGPVFGAPGFDDVIEELAWEAPPASVIAEPPSAVMAPEPERRPADVVQFAAPATVPKSKQRAMGPLGDGRTLREIQTESLRATLKRLADASGALTVSLATLAQESGIPEGSVLPVVTDLINAGELTRQKNTQPGSRSPAPSTYRLVGWKATEPTPHDPTMIPGGPEPSPERDGAKAAEAFFPADDAAPLIAVKPPAILAAPKVAEIKMEPRPAPTRQPVNVSRQLLGEPSCPAPAPVNAEAAPDEPGKAILLAEADCTAGPRALAKLRFGQCKWPLDDPGPGLMDRTLFCAAPSGEHTYCAQHTAMSLPHRARAEARA